MKNTVKTAFCFLMFCVISTNSFGESLPYIGETPPDSIPIRFGPSYLHANNDWTWFSSPEFSPDGKELYFTRYYLNLPSENVKIFYMQDIDGSWTMPQTPSFAGNVKTDSPVFFNNDKLYLVRDLTGNDNCKVYTVDRISGGWSPAQLVVMPYNNSLGSLSNISIANNKTIYFTLHTTQGAYIYRSRLVNNQYTQFEKLTGLINAYNSSSPYIDPNEKYLIFESDRPGGYGESDLYVSFIDSTGSFSLPMNMGNTINGAGYEVEASVTHDGNYLFFLSKRVGDLNTNPYWVDAGIIDQLNPFTGIDAELEKKPENIVLFQNYPNPFNPNTTINFSLNQKQFTQINIYNIKGELVAELSRKFYAAGLHSIEFDAKNLASGQYYYQLKAGDVVAVKKMLVIK